MLEIFQYDFMLRAFAAGLVIAVIAPMIGQFLVVRGYSLLSDTLAHVSLAGVAIGILAGFNAILSALVVSIVAALGMERLREGKKIMGESVLALFLSGSLAIAVVLFSLGGSLNVNVLSFLFGSIATVTSFDLYVILALGVVVFLTLVGLYKELFLISFDEEVAMAAGVRTKLLNSILVVLAAVTVVLAMRIVGALLIGALMVIPVISAVQFKRSFKKTLIISVIFSVLSVFAGLFAAFYIDLASGGTIVVVTIIIFVLSLLLGPQQTKA